MPLTHYGKKFGVLRYVQRWKHRYNQHAQKNTSAKVEPKAEVFFNPRTPWGVRQPIKKISLYVDFSLCFRDLLYPVNLFFYFARFDATFCYVWFTFAILKFKKSTPPQLHSLALRHSAQLLFGNYFQDCKSVSCLDRRLLFSIAGVAILNIDLRPKRIQIPNFALFVRTPYNILLPAAIFFVRLTLQYLRRR